MEKHGVTPLAKAIVFATAGHWAIFMRERNDGILLPLRKNDNVDSYQYEAGSNYESQSRNSTKCKTLLNFDCF